MSKDIKIELLGDEEIQQILKGLDQKIGIKTMKKVVRDAAQKNVVKQLKSDAPVRTGNLRRSMGVITGRSKRSAVMFAGPRMSHDFTKTDHSGWIANVLEFSKGQRRFPKKGKSLAPFEFPSFYKSVGPIRRKTDFRVGLKSSIPRVEAALTKSFATIMKREMNKYNKR
jgi:hypothetical protein